MEFRTASVSEEPTLIPSLSLQLTVDISKQDQYTDSEGSQA